MWGIYIKVDFRFVLFGNIFDDKLIALVGIQTVWPQTPSSQQL